MHAQIFETSKRFFLKLLKFKDVVTEKKSHTTNYVSVWGRCLIKLSVSVDGSVVTSVDSGLDVCVVGDGSGVFSDLFFLK